MFHNWRRSFLRHHIHSPHKFSAISPHLLKYSSFKYPRKRWMAKATNSFAQSYYYVFMIPKTVLKSFATLFSPISSFFISKREIRKTDEHHNLGTREASSRPSVSYRGLKKTNSLLGTKMTFFNGVERFRWPGSMFRTHSITILHLTQRRILARLRRPHMPILRGGL